MKVLLVAVNACYNHTNLAVRSIYHYVNSKIKNENLIGYEEWTINQKIQDILRGIEKHKADIIIFSSYIWNWEIIQKIICDIKKIIPECVIGCGGPEVSFYGEKYLNSLENLDFIICGEGEETSLEIVNIYKSFEFNKNKFLECLQNTDGTIVKLNNKIIFGKERALIKDLSSLPFAYPVITDPDNRIYYYESSRGCPFSCSYCLSSLDKRVRFMPLERVFVDLQKFLDANVRLVKFVDRTYNLDSDRYIAIWEYILLHHNKKTMFHFEIEAEFLDEKALNFLQKVPKGVMQFEIGVQSSNPETLKAVGRSSETKKLAENIKRIPKSIHCHLDLIAGLPYEDLESFGKSFDFVMNLKPDALQLGFLKVLHGTKMEEFSINNGWKWMDNPPYETFSTPYLSYSEMMFLKDVEVLVDVFWNSKNFEKTMNYIGSVISFWQFFYKLTTYCRKNNLFEAPHKEAFWYELFCNLINSDSSKEAKITYELLKFDFISLGKKGNFPLWYEHRYDKNKHRDALELHGGVKNARLDFAYSDYEEFDINPFNINDTSSSKWNVLFMYKRRDDENSIDKQILL